MRPILVDGAVQDRGEAMRGVKFKTVHVGCFIFIWLWYSLGYK